MAENHLVIAQGVEASLHVFLGAVRTSIVIHYSNPSSVTVSQTLANTVFDSLKSLWTTNLATHCPPTTIFTDVNLRDINTAGNALVASNTAQAPGTAAGGERLPNQIAACLTVRTARAGKMFRGRMYWPGFAETANAADNHIIAAAKTALDTFATNFITAANVGGLTFGVAHRPTAFDEITGLPISPGLGFITPATQVVCRDNIWDTQRRRAA